MEWRMSGGHCDLNSLCDLPFALDQIPEPGSPDRLKILAQVAGPDAFILTVGEIELTPLYDITSFREGRHNLAIIAAKRVSASMVEVKVRAKHDVDIGRIEPGVSNAILESGRISCVRDPINISEFLVVLVPHSSIDKDESVRSLYKQTPHGQRDSIPIVGRDTPLPEGLWNNSEHRSTVELLNTRFNTMDTNGTNLCGPA